MNKEQLRAPATAPLNAWSTWSVEEVFECYSQDLIRRPDTRGEVRGQEAMHRLYDVCFWLPCGAFGRDFQKKYSKADKPGDAMTPTHPDRFNTSGKNENTLAAPFVTLKWLEISFICCRRKKT